MRTVSQSTLASMMAEDTQHVYLMLLNIDHSTLTTPLRFCNNNEDVVHSGVTYQWYPFRIGLPGDSEEQVSVQIEIDNISPDVIELLRSIKTKPDISIRVVTLPPDYDITAPGGIVKDEAGNNDGTISGNPSFVEGVSGQALEFDEDDYVSVSPTSDSLNVNTNNEYTVSGWVKVDSMASPPSVWDPMVVFVDGVNPTRFTLGGTPRLTYRADDGTYYQYGSSNDPETDAWQHVVWVISNNTFKGYINGTLSISVSLDVPNTDCKGDVSIARSSGSSEHLIGTIDEPRIYDRALSEAEITELYEKQNVTNGLVSHWPFDDGRPTTNTVEVGPISMKLSRYDADAQTIRGTIEYEEDFLNQKFPRYRFTPQTAPGMFE